MSYVVAPSAMRRVGPAAAMTYRHVTARATFVCVWLGVRWDVNVDLASRRVVSRAGTEDLILSQGAQGRPRLVETTAGPDPAPAGRVQKCIKCVLLLACDPRLLRPGPIARPQAPSHAKNAIANRRRPRGSP